MIMKLCHGTEAQTPARAELCYQTLVCLLSWPPKINGNIGHDGVSGVICHNVQADWWNISAHYSMNPSMAEIWLCILAGGAAGFSWRIFSPVWQKMPQWWYTQTGDMEEEHTFVYFCNMTWTQWLNNLIYLVLRTGNFYQNLFFLLFFNTIILKQKGNTYM